MKSRLVTQAKKNHDRFFNDFSGCSSIGISDIWNLECSNGCELSASVELQTNMVIVHIVSGVFKRES